MQPAAGTTRQPREYVPDRAESDVDDPDLGAALERENSARHEGGQQVRTSQALRLRQHSESCDGAGSRKRQ